MAYAKISKFQMVSIGVFSCVCLTAIGLSIGLTLENIKRKESSPSRLGIYDNAAVGSDGIPCSVMGKDILLKGGNAVDAAITTTLCIGVVNTHSAGLGGGFLAVVWNATKQESYAVDAREAAPAAATEDMFSGNSSLSQKGGLASAVPGELRGLWALHSTSGSLPWRELVLPVAELANNGSRVNAHLANALREQKERILNEPTMSVFINPKTGTVWQEGDIIKRPKLAQTLEKIAEQGANVLYDGELTAGFVQDIQDKNGIITIEDMNNYTAMIRDPVEIEMYGGMRLFSSPLPGSGILLSYIVNILDEYKLSPINAKLSSTLDSQVLSLHRLTEAFKFAYAQRTKLGDADFEPSAAELVKLLTSEEFAAETRENISDTQTFNDPSYYGAEVYQPDDHGTSHISIIDEYGNAVALTATINLYFGAGYISESTGIILNDEMDDFSAPNITNAFGIPPSEANFIKPGKRPLSSMVPTIVVKDGQVRLVVGAAGGTKITSATAYVLLRNLWFGDDIKSAIDAKRIHHQIFPMNLQYESGFTPYFVDELETFGHNVTQFLGWGSVVVGLSKENDLIYANSDFRKGGDVDGY
ncbi:scoloptoxin SSD14-like isoform X2 [Artemia franciscana]|uniref:scoloptoxin SSD14-like isoform X2 n=1 Tax=Artemia franciscana TaxID=6661 RepID=UPI0032DA4E23